jgi:hypothetical protein
MVTLDYEILSDVLVVDYMNHKPIEHHDKKRKTMTTYPLTNDTGQPHY